MRPPDSSHRLVGVDALRGVAIAWVVLFHLWGDLEYFPLAPSVYYDAFARHLADGAAPWRTFTAFTDLVFRLGFEGVPLFMMISGLSLTIAAYRAGDVIAWPRFLVQRFRKLLFPYWTGVALTYAVMALIAWRQVAIGDGNFAHQFAHGVTISRASLVEIDRGVVFASIALIPRLAHQEWFFAPQLALWFVGLLAQYYLLFPLLFVVMRRIGVVAFLLLTFAVTVGANAWAVHEYRALELKFWLVTGWAPFRLIEFSAGMALGWLVASPDGARVLAWLRRPLAVAALLACGLALHTGGDLLIGRWSGEALLRGDTSLYWQAAALPCSTLGLAVVALPLVSMRPAASSVSVVLRALAAIGVMSYAILIVNDAMRLVASQVRVEDPPAALWWLFLVVVYVPASMLFAWPLARLLGLMPRPRSGSPNSSREPAPAPAPAIASA